MRDLENAIVGWTFRARAFVVTALASAACTLEAGTGSIADTLAASVGAPSNSESPVAIAWNAARFEGGAR